MTNARAAKTAREKAAEMRAEAAKTEARKRNLLVVTAVLAVIVVAVGATVLVRTLNQQKAAQVAATTPANLVDDGIVVGKANAKVTITAYEDFQCPACKAFEDANAEQFKKWAADGTAKIVYRPIALLDNYSTTEYSSRALTAVAAVVATTPTAFEKFHAVLFENQPAEGGAGLTDDKLVELATQAGATPDPVRKALADRSYDTWIAKVTDDFSKAGHNATPTVLVGDTKITDWSPDKLAAAVQKAAG